MMNTKKVNNRLYNTLNSSRGSLTQEKYKFIKIIFGGAGDVIAYRAKVLNGGIPVTESILDCQDYVVSVNELKPMFREIIRNNNLLYIALILLPDGLEMITDWEGNEGKKFIMSFSNVLLELLNDFLILQSFIDNLLIWKKI